MCDTPKSTEVRCSEVAAKGGLRYELVLSPPAAESPRVSTPPPPRPLSIEDIERKLLRAEQRRQSLELQKLSHVTEQLNNVGSVGRKREESESAFMRQAREKVEQKLDSAAHNRHSYIRGIQDKARDAVSRVEEKRKGGEVSPDKEVRLEAIRRRLDSAAEQRELHLTSLIHKLREHDRHIAEVQRHLEEKGGEEGGALLERSVRKLEAAEGKRNAMLREIQDKMREHERHSAEVRQKAHSVCCEEEEEAKENLSG